MPVIMEAFSIREYVSRMRSVDVVKCWPFDEASEEDVTAMLPPITVKKFRWWFDEVETIRLSFVENVRTKIPKEGQESDLDSESLSSIRMRRVEKMKGKAPKKRSIVELFEVAPQVERINSDEDDEDNYADSGKLKSLGTGNVGLKGKSKEKVKKKEIGMMNKRKKQKKVVKRVKEIVSNKKKRGITMKEKSSKLKLVLSLNPTAHPNHSTIGKGMLDNVWIHLKNPKVKSLPTEAKSKAKRISRLLAKNQKPDIQGHGMLKNNTKTYRAENKLCLHMNQDLNVQFPLSVKDDVVGPMRKESRGMDLELLPHSNLSNGVTINNWVDGHTAAVGKGKSIQEMRETEETSNWRGCRMNVQLPNEKQLSIQYHVSDVPNFVMQQASSQHNLLTRSMPSDRYALNGENLLRFGQHDRGKQDASFYPYSSRIPSVCPQRKAPNLTLPGLGYPVEASCSRGTSLLHLSGDLDERFASVSSLGYFRTYPQSFTSYSSISSENANRKPQFPRRTARVDCNELTLQCPWLPRMSPKELKDTICFNADQRSILETCGEQSVNSYAFGLPLNSQGELISLSSNENRVLHQLAGSSVLAGPNLSSIICSNFPSESLENKPYNGNWNAVTSSMNHLELCTMKDLGTETDSLMPSRLSLIEHCHYGRTNAVTAAIDPSFHWESKMDQMKTPSVGSTQDNRYGTYLRSEIIQQHCSRNHVSKQLTHSTMRLMGQEFRIDGRGYQGPENGKFCKDKEIITELHADTAAHWSSLTSQVLPESVVNPVFGRLNCNGLHVQEYDNNLASGNRSHVMAPEFRVSPLLADHITAMHRRGYGFSKGNSMPEVYPHFSVPAMPDYHNSSLLPENLSGCRYLKGSQSRLQASMIHDACKNASSSFLRVENKEMPVPGGRLPFEFPFPYSELRGQIQPPWYERSAEVSPPWLFEARERGPFMGYNQTFVDSDTVHPPWHLPYTRYDTDPFMYLATAPSKFSPLHASHNTIASTSMIHHPLVPVHKSSLQDSALLNRFGEKMKYQKQGDLRIRSRMFDHGNERKRKLSSASNRYSKPMKMPKLGSQEDSSHAVSAANTSSNFKCDIQYYGHGLDSASGKFKANAIECGDGGANKNVLKASSGKDSSCEVQRAPRFGPVKPTPGAGHILKPWQGKEWMN